MVEWGLLSAIVQIWFWCRRGDVLLAFKASSLCQISCWSHTGPTQSLTILVTYKIVGHHCKGYPIHSMEIQMYNGRHNSWVGVENLFNQGFPKLIGHSWFLNSNLSIAYAGNIFRLLQSISKSNNVDISIDFQSSLFILINLPFKY